MITRLEAEVLRSNPVVSCLSCHTDHRRNSPCTVRRRVQFAEDIRPDAHLGAVEE